MFTITKIFFFFFFFFFGAQKKLQQNCLWSVVNFGCHSSVMLWKIFHVKLFSTKVNKFHPKQTNFTQSKQVSPKANKFHPK